MNSPNRLEVPAAADRFLSDRLDTWKEVACHLRRSVRTVQRWERQERHHAVEWLEHAVQSPPPNAAEAHALFYELADTLESMGYLHFPQFADETHSRRASRWWIAVPSL